MTTKPIDQMTKEELAEAFDQPLTPRDAADLAKLYADMKAARHVLPDGEVMDPKPYAEGLDAINKTLKKYVEQNGAFHVEGVGTIKLQDRALGWSWDCKAMAENDMATFARLLEMGAVTLDSKVALALEQAGQVTGFKGYGHRGNTSALVVEKDR